jgi:hypothetical protein
MAEPKAEIERLAGLPRGLFKTVWEKMVAWGVDDCTHNEEVAREALRIALPAIQRDAVRQAARQILALDAADRRAHAPGMPNKGPWNDMRTSLRRLARGGSLPEVPDV